MKTWMLYGAGLLAILGLSPRALALPKGLGAVPGVPGAPGAAPAAATGLFGFLCPSPEQLEACKKKFCDSPLGKLINNGLKPVSILTGGILGNCCPMDAAPSKADQAKDGAEGLAARIAAEEANAKARRAAARYLGTVDCHVFPGVDKALVELLRKDTNECVRLEAALALGRGCCCNKVTIQGLALTVAASEKDGNRAEKSERVRAAASASLEHCLACVGTAAPQTDQAPKPRPELPPIKEKPEAGEKDKTTKLDDAAVQLSAYYQKVESLPLSLILDDAHKVLAEYQEHQAQVVQARSRSLVEVVAQALASSSPSNGLPADKSASDVASTDLRPVPTPEPPVHSTTVLGTPTTSAPAPIINWIMQRPAPQSAPMATPVIVPSQPVPQSTPAAPKTMPVIQTSQATPKAVPVIQSSQATPKAVPVTQSPTTPPVAQVARPVPAATGAVSGVSNVNQMLLVLRESIYPEQREWAADRLAAMDGKANPQVPAALVKSAREDKSPMVQVACIRGLAKMSCNSRDVMVALQALQGDGDPRVRMEATQAVTKLGGGQPNQPVIPASYMPSRTR